jgi:uncharacterized protein (TIGR03435 family)
MQELDDNALLREYVGRDSGPAFAVLVNRHIDNVYSVALRHTRNQHQAEEITQAVFVILATKASGFRKGVILEGWLYQTARFTALTYIRSEIRRARREQEALMQTVSNDNDPDTWSQIAPLVDTALARLNETDRTAVVMRFFYGKSLREVGAALGANEDSARMRINRALEKLRRFFAGRGVDSTAATIAGAISASSIQAAPAGLAKSVAAMVIAKNAAAGGANLTLIKGALKLMAWTKAQTAIVVGAGLLLAVGTASLTVKEVSHYRQETVWNQIIPSTDEDSRVAQDWQQLRNARAAVSIRPTKFDSTRSGIVGDGNGKTMGIYRPFREVLSRAYDVMPGYIVPLTPLPPGNFDFIVSGQHPPANALRMEIESKYGLVGRRETREIDVMLLRVSRPNAPGLKPSAAPNSPSISFWGVGHLRRSSGLIGQIVFDIQQNLQIPVVDQTGLTGHYDYDVKWDDELKWDDAGQWYYANTNGLKQAFLDQLGLELVPGREPVPVVVVDKK